MSADASARSTEGIPSLKRRLAEQIPEARARVRRFIKEHGDTRISDVSIAQAYGGARGVKCLVTETSALDPEEGIRFRGYSIPQLKEILPTAPGGHEPLPEGLFWLMVTGEPPTEDDVRAVSAAWRQPSELPADVRAVLDALAPDLHPMSQFSIGIVALGRTSTFAHRYHDGTMKKDGYWDATFDDAVRLLGYLPLLAAYIYRRTYHDDVHVAPAEPSLDWAANLAHMMGVDRLEFRELVRLYMTVHADHEGGNVSAHATHLVGSALSDPYLSLAAGMNGLAGPLHGLANQEVIRWIFGLKEALGPRPTSEAIRQYVWDTLERGQVIPGYGHAVLRKTDPRYMAQREFGLRHVKDDENFEIVRRLYEIVPDVLREQGKAKNPWPNVDAHSGCLLVHYGVDEYDFYTVLFGVSRAMGVLSSLVWDRALMLPIERPKSVTTEWVEKYLESGGSS